MVIRLDAWDYDISSYSDFIGRYGARINLGWLDSVTKVIPLRRSDGNYTNSIRYVLLQVKLPNRFTQNLAGFSAFDKRVQRFYT